MINDTPDTTAPPEPGARGRLALAIAEAVDSVNGVRRSPGPGVEVATQYRGGKVVGVAVGDPVRVHIVVEALPLASLADQVHWAVRYVLDALHDQRSVVVAVDDIEITSLPRGSLR